MSVPGRNSSKRASEGSKPFGYFKPIGPEAVTTTGQELAMRKLTLSILTSAAAIALSSSAGAQTVTQGQGPNLTTAIHASTTDTTNDATTVMGSTLSGGNSADVAFTGNTAIHITDGAGFASITDAPAAGTFTSLIINPTQLFSALEFNLSFATASYLQVDYSYGGGVFTNSGPLFAQNANANTGYTITSGGQLFDAIRLTSCATSTACASTGAGGLPGAGTGGAINFERQNSINLGGNSPTVPEPATWAMMLVGFGAAGYSLRRKRSVLAMQAA